MSVASAPASCAVRLACRLALSITLLLCAGGSAISQALADEAGETGSGSVQVQTAALRRGSLPQQVIAYGSIQPGLAARQSVTSPVAAVVQQVDIRPGETVSAGSALVSLRPTPESSLRYAQALSALRVANDSLQRTQRLAAQHLATTQQLTDMQKAVGDARAALDVLQAQGAEGIRVLRAHFEGVALRVAVTPGQWVEEGAALVDLARSSGRVLEAAIPPAEAEGIHVGDAATVLPLGAGTRDAAHVIVRGAIIDSESGLIAVRLALADDALPLGQSARAIITTGTVNAYIVPHSAILIDDMGERYIVQSVGGVAHKVAVHVLAERDDQSAIDGPLDPWAPIVLAGNYQATDGMRLVSGPVAAAAATTH